jgi:hypothetical protein
MPPYSPQRRFARAKYMELLVARWSSLDSPFHAYHAAQGTAIAALGVRMDELEKNFDQLRVIESELPAGGDGALARSLRPLREQLERTVRRELGEVLGQWYLVLACCVLSHSWRGADVRAMLSAWGFAVPQAQRIDDGERAARQAAWALRSIRDDAALLAIVLCGGYWALLALFYAGGWRPQDSTAFEVLFLSYAEVLVLATAAIWPALAVRTGLAAGMGPFWAALRPRETRRAVGAYMLAAALSFLAAPLGLFVVRLPGGPDAMPLLQEIPAAGVPAAALCIALCATTEARPAAAPARRVDPLPAAALAAGVAATLAIEAAIAGMSGRALAELSGTLALTIPAGALLGGIAAGIIPAVLRRRCAAPAVAAEPLRRNANDLGFDSARVGWRVAQDGAFGSRPAPPVAVRAPAETPQPAGVQPD